MGYTTTCIHWQSPDNGFILLVKCLWASMSVCVDIDLAVVTDCLLYWPAKQLQQWTACDVAAQFNPAISYYFRNVIPTLEPECRNARRQ